MESLSVGREDPSALLPHTGFLFGLDWKLPLQDAERHVTDADAE